MGSSPSSMKTKVEEAILTFRFNPDNKQADRLEDRINEAYQFIVMTMQWWYDATGITKPSGGSTMTDVFEGMWFQLSMAFIAGDLREVKAAEVYWTGFNKLLDSFLKVMETVK